VSAPRLLRIAVDERSVPATLYPSARGAPTLALAPGAGSSRGGPLLSHLAEALAAGGVEVLTFDFFYREAGRRFPDPAPVREACWRAVATWLGAERGAVPFVGGHSMGGRAASTAVAAGMRAAGLVLLGYPLYPAGKRADRAGWRDVHLAAMAPPSLFVSGSRDELGATRDLRAVLRPLAGRAELHVVRGADHGFEVQARGRRTRAAVLAEVVATCHRWITARAHHPG
jgi:predicted alpha/beta-hydrolase family hydrolase